MERDFLRLSLNFSSVKEETGEGECKDLASARSSGMQRSFPDKISTHPQFLSFNTDQLDWPKQNAYDAHDVTSRVTPMSMPDAFDPNKKLHSAVLQKSLALDKKQSGSHFALTAYPQPFDAHSPNRPHDVKMYPVPAQPNEAVSVAMSAPILQSYLASTGQNVVSSTINKLPLGRFPISILSTNDLSGNASKPSEAPPQMIIFYAGSVRVYDDVPPDKAQAIMLLAENGPSVTTPKAALSTSQVQAPIPQSPVSNIFARNQPHASPSFLALPSPVSSTRQAAPQSGGASASNNEIVDAKPVGTLAPSIAAPQFRKASLARFFEKRKERAMTAMPYTVSKKSPDCSTPKSNVGANLSVNFVGSSPLPATD